MKIYTVLQERAQRFSDKPAIIFQGTIITFAELKDRVVQLASALQSVGVKKTDKVAVYLPNYPEYIYSYFALFSLGAVVVPLDFMLTETEVIDFINHSDATVLIAQEKRGTDLATVKAKCPALTTIVIAGKSEVRDAADGFLCWDELLKKKGTVRQEEVHGKDHAAIFYTSGSTGHPKGVLLTYGHLDNPIKCIDHFLHPTDADSYLCAGVPFSHVGGLDYMLFMLSFGSTLILMDRFHPLESLKNIEKYKPTIFCVVPAMFIAILSLKECEKFDLSSLRYPVVFGAPSAPALLKRFHTLCPNASLRNGWGLTETAAPNSYSPDDINKINSIGPLGVDMEAKIVDDGGNTLSHGERGELRVKGSPVMVGYYKEEELTREVITDDGWFRTGDIAYFDQDGLCYIVGRKKEMIKVAGEIVFAPEVEAVIHRNPKVEEVAVIGIPDELRGEVPRAFIVTKEGQEITFDELRAFCREHMAPFKIPHSIEIKDALPKNRVGKIDKEQLKRI